MIRRFLTNRTPVSRRAWRALCVIAVLLGIITGIQTAVISRQARQIHEIENVAAESSILIWRCIDVLRATQELSL